MIKRKKHRRFGCKLQEKLYAKERKLELLNDAHKRCIAARELKIAQQNEMLVSLEMINTCLMRHLDADNIELSADELRYSYNEYYGEVTFKDDSIEFRIVKKNAADAEPAADNAGTEPAAD